ncbi:hypothetical protein B0H34DRAFT_731960 [Crassisporium funariophilum]|nr:hypothetical protein B0H34DRAFT_731960 [Crassisporium funariophilum]
MSGLMSLPLALSLLHLHCHSRPPLKCLKRLQHPLNQPTSLYHLAPSLAVFPLRAFQILLWNTNLPIPTASSMTPKTPSTRILILDAWNQFPATRTIIVNLKTCATLLNSFGHFSRRPLMIPIVKWRRAPSNG